MKENFKQLSAHKSNSLGEKDQCLERYNLSNLIQEERDNQNKPISNKIIESVNLNLSTQKEQNDVGSKVNSVYPFIARNYTNSPQFFQKMKQRKHFLTMMLELHKLDKATTRKQCRHTSQIRQNLKQILASFQQCICVSMTELQYVTKNQAKLKKKR